MLERLVTGTTTHCEFTQHFAHNTIPFEVLGDVLGTLYVSVGLSVGVCPLEELPCGLSVFSGELLCGLTASASTSASASVLSPVEFPCCFGV